MGTPKNDQKQASPSDLEQFQADIFKGFQSSPKCLPSHYMYDAWGSKLFTKITKLPNYYLARAEITLLQSKAAEISEYAKKNSALIEFGAGSIVKASLLLSASNKFSSYIPIDITEGFHKSSVDVMAQQFPHINYTPICGDFLSSHDLMGLTLNRSRFGALFGATLGNLERDQIAQFLTCAQATLGLHAPLIVSLDILTDLKTHLKAYANDKGNIRRAFFDNFIHRINMKLNANFDTQRFHYEAKWNPQTFAIEMTYISQETQQIKVAERSYDLARHEPIILKRSYKYPIDYAKHLFAIAKYDIAMSWQLPHTSCYIFLLAPAFKSG